MDIVFREAAKKAGKAIDEQQATMRKEMFRQVVEDQSSAYYTSSRIIDDGIIGSFRVVLSLLSPLCCWDLTRTRTTHTRAQTRGTRGTCWGCACR
jgi:hypothetical protein